jgi:hypothetical protein
MSEDVTTEDMAKKEEEVKRGGWTAASTSPKTGFQKLLEASSKLPRSFHEGILGGKNILVW